MIPRIALMVLRSGCSLRRSRPRWVCVALLLVALTQTHPVCADQPTSTDTASIAPSDASVPSDASAPSDASTPSVDVRTEIWPLLQRHCLRCHHPNRSDGDLRLDRIEAIRSGGHTGNPILGTVDNSELLRRINSTDPGYRMPKEGESLREDDVALLTRWIERGAPWPENESALPGIALAEQSLTPINESDDPQHGLGRQADSWPSWLSEQLDVVAEYQEPMRPILFGLLVACLLVLVVERRKRRCAEESLGAEERSGPDDGTTTDWAHKVTYAHYCLVIMGFLWAATFVFFGVHQRKLQDKHDDLADKLNQRQVWVHARDQVEQPKGPYRPKHPPWMGGVYYRGNDERNDRLFNGGFYATSKMYLSLRDRSSDSISWNDEVDIDTLAVCLEIERSPFATPPLFTDESLTQCFLRLADSPDRPSQPSQKATLQVLESGERWRACYPLRGLAETRGDVSRYEGGIDLCNSGGQPHYGIRYDIIVQDGRIGSASEIWMGATFLTANVVVPQEGKIPLREWFDFVPIPEITKRNTQDPDLLGITEHVKNKNAGTDDTDDDDQTNIESDVDVTDTNTPPRVSNDSQTNGNED